VLSEQLWRRRLNADAGIVGRTVVLNGVSRTVVGVASARFNGSFVAAPVDAWTPLATSSRELGADWQVDRTVGLLDSMNAIDEFVVVGVYSRDRMAEYTKPGYTAYGESLIGEVKPRIDREFRTMPEPERTGVIGSSLGGVVSFFLAWEWPEVFGGAACLSSTFGHQDDLLERVMSEEKRHARFYLDSGWPEDNYEVTVAMAMALVSRGWVYGRDLLHFAFPLAEHDERSWGLRLHLPLQLFQGSVRNVSNRVQAAAEAAAEEKPPPEV